jgi:hypothetical protein
MKVKPTKPRRLSIGIPELDKMMDGGIRESGKNDAFVFERSTRWVIV